MSIKFVELAVSKDEMRLNLCKVYRDKSHLVATDGHRLHAARMSDNLDRGHYLDGTQAEFPDWALILPKDPAVCNPLIQIDKARLKGLKALYQVDKALRTGNTVTTLRFYTDEIQVVTAYDNGVTTASAPLSNLQPIIHEIGINYSYLYQAIEGIVKEGYSFMNLSYYGPTRPLSVTAGNLAAYIMPMELSEK